MKVTRPLSPLSPPPPPPPIYISKTGAVDVDKIDDPVNRAAKIAQISNFGQIPKQLFKDKHPAKNMQKLNQAMADCVFSHTMMLMPFQIGTGGAVGSVVFINDVPVMLAPRKVCCSFRHPLSSSFLSPAPLPPSPSRRGY